MSKWVGQVQRTHKCTLDEAAANALHVLTGVACALLSKQIQNLADCFLNEGGFTERLYHKRKQQRQRK